MKKLVTSVTLVAFLSMAIGFTACKSKPKDADVQAAIETALKADPAASGIAISVANGVATITGECKDELSKIHLADLVKGIKGVKDVVNNTTIAPPPAPVMNAEDAALTSGITDALKDIPGVKGAVAEGKIVLTGEIAKAKWAMLKQTLDKLTPKGYDLTGLTIK